mmetsp:Transcript_116156/g.339705  ORF Transcript_116156/g.339705 Transcript_116156/m.339705 type:complete len:257 (+) Transcript_116156:286-1056(+)
MDGRRTRKDDGRPTAGLPLRVRGHGHSKAAQGHANRQEEPLCCCPRAGNAAHHWGHLGELLAAVPGRVDGNGDGGEERDDTRGICKDVFSTGLAQRPRSCVHPLPWLLAIGAGGQPLIGHGGRQLPHQRRTGVQLLPTGNQEVPQRGMPVKSVLAAHPAGVYRRDVLHVDPFDEHVRHPLEEAEEIQHGRVGHPGPLKPIEGGLRSGLPPAAGGVRFRHAVDPLCLDHVELGEDILVEVLVLKTGAPSHAWVPMEP